MTVVKLADAKAHLSELIDRAQAGETISITRHGKAVAQLVAAKPERKPIRIAELRALTEDQPRQSESAGDFIRRMRDEDRY
jgi:prevent-host-death family protein